MAKALSELTIDDICRAAPVIPVLVIEDLRTAKPLAQALVKGGLPVLEVTLRTPAALGAIHEMSKVPGAIVGAGTLLSANDVIAAKDAGAQFGVSPGTTEKLMHFLDGYDMPFLPGASSASEAMTLLERGYSVQKFFPAEAAGGVDMLKSLSGPLPQARFCPTGGVSPENMRDYLSLPNVICVGGSWVVPKNLLADKDWAGITALAHAATQI